MPSTLPETILLFPKKSMIKNSSYRSDHLRTVYGGDFLQSFLLNAFVLSVIFVNGWTDAPNSITTIVATGTLSFRCAALLAAFFELTGVLTASLLCPAVAQTIFTMVDFGSDLDSALIALQAALFSIILWAVLAWRFGIPTSESHALIAGLTGSAAALHGSLSGVSAEAWLKVLLGLLLSTLCGMWIGSYTVRHLKIHNLSVSQIRSGQILCTISMAFFHGAQDGQKFLALLLLAQTLAKGQITQHFFVSVPLAVLCAVVMACGVLCGGQRIVRTVSKCVPDFDCKQGLITDLIGSGCLFAASLAGLPISTTHTKISILLGAGMSSDTSKSTSQTVAFRILVTWLATFPCCGFLAWFLTRLILH